MRGILRVLLALGVALAGGGQAAFAWPAAQAKAGAEAHPRILRAHGGEIENAALTRYVRSVADRIIQRTPQAGEPWVVSVVDTPAVNAFATQGGYIYVTRGLLALANNEAELAAVLAHEIAHITQNHVQARQKRGNRAGLGVLVGAVLGGLADGKDGLKKGIEIGSQLAGGYVAQYSQKQEYDADLVGQRFLIAAGYAPMAAADFLSAMAAKHALEAEIAGKEYNPNQVSIFASHPATGDRVRRARAAAGQYELASLLRYGEQDYMQAIDGMIYGDSAAQGFVRGRVFSHPEIRFEFVVPRDFVITNSAQAVISKGPRGATFVLESGGAADMAPDRFISTKWAPGLKRKLGDVRLRDLQRHRINGLDTARGLLPFKKNGADWIAVLHVVELNGRFYRLTGTAQAGDRANLRGIEAAAETFRELSAREAARMASYRVDTHRVRAGDTVARLLRNTPDMARKEERFLAMNGLDVRERLRAGDIVKLIVE